MAARPVCRLRASMVVHSVSADRTTALPTPSRPAAHRDSNKTTVLRAPQAFEVIRATQAGAAVQEHVRRRLSDSTAVVREPASTPKLRVE